MFNLLSNGNFDPGSRDLKYELKQNISRMNLGKSTRPAKDI
jgi:hypothetical protein